MWGNFEDNTAAQGNGCGNNATVGFNVNCDAPSAGAAAALGLLQNKYN
jgi:hypothetical protein